MPAEYLHHHSYSNPSHAVETIAISGNPFFDTVIYLLLHLTLEISFLKNVHETHFGYAQSKGLFMYPSECEFQELLAPDNFRK